MTRLKERLMKLGLIQANLAEQIGITIPKMSLIATGRVEPNETLKKKIAEVLGTTPGRLWPRKPKKAEIAC